RDESLLEDRVVRVPDPRGHVLAAVRANGDAGHARGGARAGACGEGTNGRTVPVQLPREDDELSRGASAVRPRRPLPEARKPDDWQRLRVRRRLPHAVAFPALRHAGRLDGGLANEVLGCRTAGDIPCTRRRANLRRRLREPPRLSAGALLRGWT